MPVPEFMSMFEVSNPLKQRTHREVYYGVWRGRVEENLDPEKLKRVRVRVLQVYTDVDTLDLPWAWPGADSFGGLPEEGVVAIPSIGADIWVMFEHGDPDFPIFFGSIHGNPAGNNEVPQNARGDQQQDQIDAKGTDSFLDANGATVTEPDNPFAAEYPNNYVFKTSRGLMLEMDNTEGAERIHIWHPSGSFIEIHPDGTIVKKTTGQQYVVIDNDCNIHVKGAKSVRVDGNTSLSIGGDYDLSVGGDWRATVVGRVITTAGVEIVDFAPVINHN